MPEQSEWGVYGTTTLGKCLPVDAEVALTRFSTMLITYPKSHMCTESHIQNVHGHVTHGTKNWKSPQCRSVGCQTYTLWWSQQRSSAEPRKGVAYTYRQETQRDTVYVLIPESS